MTPSLLKMPDSDAASLRHSLIDRLRSITETAAPTFAEAKRAALIASLWCDAGTDPEIDEVGNVVVEVPGGRGPRVLIAAHLDTVFGADVDVRVRDDSERPRRPYDAWCGSRAASFTSSPSAIGPLPAPTTRR